MRRKPSASHWVKKSPPLMNRPMSLEFFSGLQVVKISRSKGASPSGRFSSTSCSPSMRKLQPWPFSSTRERFSSSPSSLSGCAGTAGLRRSVILFSTRVLAGSRSKVRSTVSIQNAGGA